MYVKVVIASYMPVFLFSCTGTHCNRCMKINDCVAMHAYIQWLFANDIIAMYIRSYLTLYLSANNILYFVHAYMYYLYTLHNLYS